ncbi:hypothetical protein [Allorhizobium undicola]|uniref:hypothetical protein n=1 Tax=Allorhizobium undicola TaxID=78527 RepID=UPI0012B67852|nr:hypothetical protein [Allorhizobium undicola]
MRRHIRNLMARAVLAIILPALQLREQRQRNARYDKEFVRRPLDREKADKMRMEARLKVLENAVSPEADCKSA